MSRYEIRGWFLCPACDKRTYYSRKIAKEAAKRTSSSCAPTLRKGLRPYECPAGNGWHVGHLPPAVIYGDKTVDEFYGRERA